MRRVVVLLLFIGLLNASLKDDVQNTANSFIGGAAAFISGGILTSAGAEGGFPHFDAGLGFNITGFKFTHPLTGEQIPFPGLIPLMYAEVGLFDGFSLTPLINGVGAIDIIGRVMPTMSIKDYFNKDITPSYWAGGIKLQLLKDQLVPPTPAISLSFMYHSFGNIGFIFDTLYTEFSLTNISIHADVSKSLLFFTPYAGIGYDSYNLKGQYWTTSDHNKKDIAKIDGSHMRYYGGLQFNILLIKINLEAAYMDKPGKTVISLGARAGI